MGERAFFETNQLNESPQFLIRDWLIHCGVALGINGSERKIVELLGRPTMMVTFVIHFQVIIPRHLPIGSFCSLGIGLLVDYFGIGFLRGEEWQWFPAKSGDICFWSGREGISSQSTFLCSHSCSIFWVIFPNSFQDLFCCNGFWTDFHIFPWHAGEP